MKLKLLGALTEPIPVNELTKDEVKELQTALNRLGYPVGDIDGLAALARRPNNSFDLMPQ